MTRWKHRSALALPLLIGALSWCALRLAVAPIGDAIASGLVRAVPSATSAAPPSSVTEPDPSAIAVVAPIPDPTDEQLESVGALPRRVASRTPAPHRASAEEGAAITAAAADVAPAPASPPVGDAPKATIFVPAALVARALERRDVGATNAITPDGAQLGARLVGVSKYRTGLRDGDVVVSVAGTRTPTVSAMTTAALQAAGGVAPRISGRILRGDTTMTVVLELPR
jgi:hypothetical protein